MQCATNGDSIKKFDFNFIYFILPIILWPLVFIVFAKYFVYAMGIAAAILALLTLWKKPKLIKWKSPNISKVLAFGIIGSVILYLLFLLGYYLAIASGLGQYVNLIYSLIYSQAPKLAIVVLLAIIGFFEEVYWRGGVQGYVSRNWKSFSKYPWIISTAYYSLVHITTLNPVLVLAAFLVGLVTSLIASRHGIVSSAIAHILWIEAIIIFLPVIVIH